MSKPELTKQLIAQKLKKIMMTTPLDKISVQDIVTACELNRKTFYYHFQDKQALVCWIFDTEFASLTDLNQDNSTIDELIEHLHVNKDFYIAALSSSAQNNLREHLYKIVHDAIKTKILTILGTRKMAPDTMSPIVDYFSNAVIGSITKWASEGMRNSPGEYSVNFHSITQECLEFIIDRHI